MTGLSVSTNFFPGFVALLEDPVIGIGTDPSPSFLDEELEVTGARFVELLEYEGMSIGVSISSDEEESP